MADDYSVYVWWWVMTDRSDLTQRIVDILARHRYLPEGKCSCGHDSTSYAPENWAYHQHRHHDPHVAKEIVAMMQLSEFSCEGERWWSTPIEKVGGDD